MKTISLYQARTKCSEICDRVASKGHAIVVTRRSRPLVKIEPISEAGFKSSSVWDRRAKYEKRYGRMTEDFSLPSREKQSRFRGI